MKKRHKWGELKKSKFTEQQQCVKCNLYRFKVFGIWNYTHQEITDKTPLVDAVINRGCI